MSTTNLKLENIFPTYELLDTVATKASIVNAINTANATENDAIVVNGVTITFVAALGTPGANEIHVVRGNVDLARNRARLAINGTEDVAVGYGSALDSAEGVDGVKAVNGTTANDISVETETAGAFSLILTNTTGSLVTAAGLVVTSGTAATGAIRIDLSDLNITDNALTVGETQDDTGDYRQLIYHVIRKYQEYLDLQESVSAVTSVGGANYTVGDALVFTGGSPTVAASGTVSAIDGTGNPTTFTLSGGTGYQTVPTVTISSASATTVATTGATLTANAPAMLAISKGTLTENTATGIISRSWTVSFGFNETGLTLASD